MKQILGALLSIVLLLAACGQKPLTWQEQYDLGIRYLSDGNYEEAIIAFNAAIEIDPRRSEAYISLAEVYEKTGDAELAITILTQGYEATGDDSFVDRIAKLEDKQIPILTDTGRRDFIWAYTLLEAQDYATLCQEGDQWYIDKVNIDNVHALPFDKYIGLCFDGQELHREFDGVSMKILDSRHWYYGQLVNGQPQGIGICYCYLPQMNGIEGTLRYELFEGEWKDGLANGNGVLTTTIGNTAGEQCRTTYEGTWVNNAIDGEVVEKSYTDDVMTDEYHYTCDLGYYVLDERWIQELDGDYVLPSVYVSEYNVRKSYQTNVKIAVLGE